MIDNIPQRERAGTSGPLAGIRIIEFGGIGPAPMCAMLLADLGAQLLRLERIGEPALGTPRPLRYDLLLRSRKSIAINLKDARAAALVHDLIRTADASIEGFRPGVAERLGIGPDDCLAINPRLVYGRMTGWGSSGPLAHTAGHDLNYIALTGALNAIGRKGAPPTPPLALLGDFAGGGLYMALGIVSALLERERSGKGQVVDAAILDGTASLMTVFFGLLAAGVINERRGENLHDSGAFFYDVYECADGRWMAVAAIEDKFRAELFRVLDIPRDAALEGDRAQWPAIRARIADRFKTRTRQEWSAIFAGIDACVSPVLSMSEVASHPHTAQRGTFVEIDGVVQPAPAPRFSRTRTSTPLSPTRASGDDAEQLLTEWGAEASLVRELAKNGVIA